MPTMVQTPDVASTEISGLAPVMRPVGVDGLGSFLQSVVPALYKEAKVYQQETAAKNIALGVNDQMNGAHREVSFLDRQNYNYGLSVAKVQSGQSTLQKQFQADIDAVDVDNPDPEALFKIKQKYLNDTVDNIYNSSLPTDLKEKMYSSTIKENSVYQGLINTKMQQITEDAEYATRVDVTTNLARDLKTKGFTADGITVLVKTAKQKLEDSMLGKVVKVWDDGTKSFVSRRATKEDVQKEFETRSKAAFTYALNSLEASGQSSDLQQLELLQDVSDNMLDMSLDLSTQVQSKSIEIRSKIMDNNASYLGREVDSMLSEWELNPELATKDSYDKAVADIAARSDIDITAQSAEIGKITSRYTSINNAIRNATKVADVSLYESPAQYEAIGKSESDWSKDWLQSYLKEFNGDTIKAGLAMIEKGGGTSSNYSGKAVQTGSEVLFRSILGAAQQTDAEAAKDPYFKYRKEAFNQAGQMYREAKRGNGTKAIDMLSGIDPKYVDVFEVVMENGGSINELREAFKSPVQMTESLKYTNEAISKITPEHLGLGKSILGGDGGQFFNNMSNSLEGNYTAMVQEAITTSKHKYVPNTQGSSPEALLSKVKGDILLPSQTGYSSTIASARGMSAIRGYKVSGTNTPLGSEYVAQAIDAQREAIAKNYGTRPDNVIVRLDESGQTAQFYAYKIEDNWGGIKDGKAVLANGNDQGMLSGGVVSMARIKHEAEGFYNKSSKGKHYKPKDDVNITGVRIGSTVVIDQSSNSRKGVGVKVNGLYAEAMGGNIDLAKKFVAHLGVYEGFLSHPKNVSDRNSGKVSTVVGMGITRATASDKTWNMLDQARGNPQRVMDIQGGFMNNYYKKQNISTDLAKAGVPMPTSAPYPAQYERSLMLLYDVAWHGSNGGLYGTKGGTRDGVIDAMNAPNLSAGLKKLRNSTVYDRSNTGGAAKRNKWYEESLRLHFKARGL